MRWTQSDGDSGTDDPGTADGVDTRDRSRWVERHPEAPLVRVPDLGTRGDTLLAVVLVLLGALIAQVLFLGVGIGLLELAGLTETTDPVAFLTVQSALGLCGLLAAGLVALSRLGDPGLVGLGTPTRRDAALVVGGVALLAGLQFVAGLLFDQFGVEIADNVILERGREHPELFLALVPVQFLLTAPAEELLFRGVVQGLLRRAYGVVPAVSLASAIFALFHLSAFDSGAVLPGLAVVFLSGLVLGALYEYSRTLLVPILAHALWNSLLFGTEYAAAVGV